MGAAGDRLKDFVALGRHGAMDWLADTADRRADPLALWSDARSVVLFGANYGPDGDPLETLRRRDRATISVYARNRDYHDVLKGALKRIASRWEKAAREAGVDPRLKVFVDTAPLLEKPLAAAAGIGWQGKHTNLVSRDHGSWLFLAAMLLAADLPADAPHADRCGTCRRCLDACPTDAFPAPYQLDARRCISYLTIEHDRPIDRALRPLIGNRVYGCDDCLAVCPWNRFASEAREAKFHARDDLRAPPLAFLAALDDAAFRAHFTGSPIKRVGREKFVSNVLVAIGNSGDAALAAVARRLLDDSAPLVRAMAVWALGRLDLTAARDERDVREACEGSMTVRDEWAALP